MPYAFAQQDPSASGQAAVIAAGIGGELPHAPASRVDGTDSTDTASAAATTLPVTADSADTSGVQAATGSADTQTAVLADTVALAATAAEPAPHKPLLAAAPADTSARFYDAPFFAFGTGWTLGSMPLFEQWQKGLPDSIGDMPGYYPTYQSVRIASSEQEPADAYNTAFPFSVSVVPFVNNARSISAAASMWWMSKRYIARWLSDTAGVFWHVERELSLLAVSLGAQYYYRIPAEYFAIANIDRAFLVLGLSAAPYVRITDRRNDYSDVTAVTSSFSHTYRGYCGSWTAGISTIRPLSARSGIEIGIVYDGQWVGRFIKRAHHVRWSAISDNADKPNEVISFMAHRFKIFFNILIGRRPHTDDVPTGAPASSVQPAPQPADTSGRGQ